jgi:hypothetical protein
MSTVEIQVYDVSTWRVVERGVPCISVFYVRAIQEAASAYPGRRSESASKSSMPSGDSGTRGVLIGALYRHPSGRHTSIGLVRCQLARCLRCTTALPRKRKLINDLTVQQVSAACGSLT